MRFAASLLIALCFQVCVGAAELPCGAGRSVRNLVGPSPLASQLRAIAMRDGDFFFNKGEFEEETFTYLGEVVRPSGAKWYVAFLETIWGSSCRSTPRLLIFSKDMKYLGQYSHFAPRRFHIEGNTIFFDDAEPNHGNTVQFSDDGPPKKAWIDGENPAFYR